jgi:hypothetical protein
MAAAVPGAKKKPGLKTKSARKRTDLKKKTTSAGKNRVLIENELGNRVVPIDWTDSGPVVEWTVFPLTYDEEADTLRPVRAVETFLTPTTIEPRWQTCRFWNALPRVRACSMATALQKAQKKWPIADGWMAVRS